MKAVGVAVADLWASRRHPPFGQASPMGVRPGGLRTFPTNNITARMRAKSQAKETEEDLEGEAEDEVR